MCKKVKINHPKDKIEEYLINIIPNGDLVICDEIFNKFNDYEKIIFTKNNFLFNKYNVITFEYYNIDILERILKRQSYFLHKKVQ